MNTPETSDFLRQVAGMLSDGESPEYDRACVEIVWGLLPLDGEDDMRAGVEALLRCLR